MQKIRWSAVLVIASLLLLLTPGLGWGETGPAQPDRQARAAGSAAHLAAVSEQQSQRGDVRVIHAQPLVFPAGAADSSKPRPVTAKAGAGKAQARVVLGQIDRPQSRTISARPGQAGPTLASEFAAPAGHDSVARGGGEQREGSSLRASSVPIENGRPRWDVRVGIGYSSRRDNFHGSSFGWAPVVVRQYCWTPVLFYPGQRLVSRPYITGMGPTYYRPLAQGTLPVGAFYPSAMGDRPTPFAAPVVIAPQFIHVPAPSVWPAGFCPETSGWSTGTSFSVQVGYSSR